MSLFGKKNVEKSGGLLGVDLGTTGLKVVELAEENGKIRLLTYGYADIPLGSDTSPLTLDDPKKLADILRAVMKKSGMKANRAVAALPGSSVFHAIITIPTPKSTRDDIRPLVETQIAKLLPLPLEEMIIDSHVIDKEFLPVENQPEATSASKTVRVQVTAAPKSLVEKYVAIFRLANIQLVSLETEAFALMRSLVGKDTAKVMIVDIGGERTNVVIAERGVPYVTRGVKSGGKEITQALASALGIGLSEAEVTKKDLALSKDGAVMPPVVMQAIKPLLHEVKYALTLYAQQDAAQDARIDKVIVTGGSSGLLGLDAAMTGVLDVNVYIGDPWARIATPPEARGVLDEVGSRLAVAIGLAMRAKEEKAL